MGENRAGPQQTIPRHQFESGAFRQLFRSFGMCQQFDPDKAVILLANVHQETGRGHGRTRETRYTAQGTALLQDRPRPVISWTEGGKHCMWSGASHL